MYDVLIISGSCAGLSAAMTACKHNLNAMVMCAGDGNVAAFSAAAYVRKPGA